MANLINRVMNGGFTKCQLAASVSRNQTLQKSQHFSVTPPVSLIRNGCVSRHGGSMANLCKAARGRECQVRIPGVCNGNPETSVLAHIRLAGLCGTGIKPPDLIATIACSSCHDEIDRRTRLVDAEYAKECALEGMARTQVIWLKEGLVKA